MTEQQLIMTLRECGVRLESEKQNSIALIEEAKQKKHLTPFSNSAIVPQYDKGKMFKLPLIVVYPFFKEQTTADTQSVIYTEIEEEVAEVESKMFGSFLNMEVRRGEYRDDFIRTFLTDNKTTATTMAFNFRVAALIREYYLYCY
mgnify:FL=1